MLFRGYEGLYFSHHLQLSNLGFNLFFILLSLGGFVWGWMTKTSTTLQLRELGLDYFIGLLYLFFYMPLIVLMNTALGVFFILELSSNLVLLTFVSLQNLNKKPTTQNTQPTLTYGFHLIFFQF